MELAWPSWVGVAAGLAGHLALDGPRKFTHAGDHRSGDRRLRWQVPELADGQEQFQQGCAPTGDRALHCSVPLVLF